MQPPSSPLPAPQGRLSVLVIDDDADVRLTLQRTLERDGFRVQTARDGAEGLARFREGQFALVVTDIMMPVMDGIEVIRALRAEHPALPIIAMSGVSDWDRLLRIALDLGASAGLHKPVRPAELMRAIWAALPIGT